LSQLRSDIGRKTNYAKGNTNFQFTPPSPTILVSTTDRKEEEEFPKVPTEDNISTPPTIRLLDKQSVISIKNMKVISCIG